EVRDGAECDRVEGADVVRIKAAPRLAEVVQRAIELSVQPAPAELVLRVDGVFVSVREREVAELLDVALAPGVPLVLVRDRFRMALLRRFYERYGELLGPQAFRTFDEVERDLRRHGFLTKYLDRVP